ncbi:MAG: valine--tRNA ligase [Candidatus Hodarchaeota archaeon]
MVSKDLERKTYDPQFVEEGIYDFWEKNGFFNPDTQKKLNLITDKSPRFCLTLPPPNVTGQLHLGHAITIAIEDLMTRFARMRQKETLFLPGSDHAGIATQNVVERELRKQGINRKDLGREKFIEKVWEWKHKYHARITEQSKKLGMSADWSRERFTLDEQLSGAVREAFIRLYKKGLIYRGQYMVNWCPRCESAISDLEAEPEEEVSYLWYIKYPVANDDWEGPPAMWGSGRWAEGATEFIEVATTRPETLLGDTGVATTQNHPIYKSLIGKMAVLPGNGRKIPIFEDPYVDPEFGTGALKITPGHDPNDYEIGKQHNLEFLTVIDEVGVMCTDDAARYEGMDRFECRERIVRDLEEEGLLSKIEDYMHAVPYCQRCHTLIEPRISEQWFVKTKGLAEAAMQKVRDGETTILPEREEKRFFQWMENIRDWCISRQLWWGHRIPVWYCSNGHQVCETYDPSECPECYDKELVQDEDVLDTWFSSGLWPFSTLGWPDKNSADLKRFYTTDMRETGYDILFFWVAREMMLGCELAGATPYKTVYCHGIVRNEKGKKISKSMENVEQYDPLNIIAEYGADSLRFNLISNTVPGQDINLDPRQFEAARRFCNKIWQSTKFVLSHLKKGENIPKFDGSYPADKLQYADKWIISQLNRLVRDVTDAIEKYDYLSAARDIRSFYWGTFCDWYLEITKIRFYGEEGIDTLTPKVILSHVLDTCSRLLHPIMPYLTEALWQALPDSIKDGPALIVAKWPEVNESMIDDEIDKGFTTSIDLIKEIRSARVDFNVPVGSKIPLLIDAGDKGRILEITKEEIATLAKVDIDKMEIGSGIDPPEHAGRIIIHGMTAYIPLEGIIDIEVVKNKLEKAKAKAEGQLKGIEKKLASPFAERAPPDVVQKERDKLEVLKDKLKKLEDQLEHLG